MNKQAYNQPLSQLSILQHFLLNSLSKFKPYQINLLNEWIYANRQKIKAKGITKNIIKKLKQSYPVEYITGYTYFYNQKFFVKYNKCKVYIPSLDSEKIIDKAFQQVIKIYSNPNNQNLNLLILDLGTGSGALLLSLYSKLKNYYASNKPNNAKYNANFENAFTFIGTDISSCAIKIARKNKKSIAPLAKNIKLIKANIIFKPTSTNTSSNTKNMFLISKLQVHNLIRNAINKKNFIIILFNKPYVTQKQYQKLEKTMYYYPKKALLETQSFKYTYQEFIKYLNKLKYKKYIFYIQETRYSKNKMRPKLITKLFLILTPLQTKTNY